MLTVLPRGDFAPPEGKTWTELQIDLESDDAQRYLGVRPERLRQWVARGRVKRGSAPNTYDMGSVLAYLHERQLAGEPTCEA